MALKVAVQMDPIQSINISGDSTFAMMLEAQKRGHSPPATTSRSGMRRATTSRLARSAAPISAYATSC